MEPIEIVNDRGLRAWSDAATALRRGLGLEDETGALRAGLYDIPGYGPGTFAQYVLYTCLGQADANEGLATALMNIVSRRAGLMKAQAAVMEQILSGEATLESRADLGDYICDRAGESPTIGEFLTLECGFAAADLKSGIGTFSGRQAVSNKLQVCMQSTVNESEFRQADLQMALNRVEKCVVTGSNLVRQVGSSQANSARMVS